MKKTDDEWCGERGEDMLLCYSCEDLIHKECWESHQSWHDRMEDLYDGREWKQ